MNCAWQAYLNLLPIWMRQDVDRLGKNNLQELRLRIDRSPELVTGNTSSFVDKTVSADDLSYVINAASRYSPWTSGSITGGYITASGGHRIGICGEVVILKGRVHTIKEITSLCIRVARDYPGIASKVGELEGSLLILGPPGSGKTTLLRDMIRQRGKITHSSVAVVDERRELFPTAENRFCFFPGLRTEVLSGCSKVNGMEMLLRTMNPATVAVDEITAEEDSNAILYSAWCGVDILATAHGKDWQDFLHRPAYRRLAEENLFPNVIVMRKDKSWYMERMNK